MAITEATRNSPERSLGEPARPLSGPPGEPRNVGYLFIGPAVILYALFVLVPFGHTIYLAFFNWDGIGPQTFAGLSNFRQVFGSAVMRSAFEHAFALIFFYAILTTLIGLLLAGVMARGRVRGLTFFRAVLFIPYVIAPTAIAVIWRWLLAPDGPLNSALSAIGLGGLTRPWLGDFSLALPSVGLTGTWVMYGLAMVLLIAGVQKIPGDLYDAARIDGAGPVREFLAVTLPGLRNEIVVVLVLTVTAALRNFDVIYVMTQGGPGTTTTVPSLLVYNEAFVAGSVGAAAAIGVILAALIFAVNAAITRLGTR
jgi:raffinose/stachyose/melibiose transport system permease protein